MYIKQSEAPLFCDSESLPKTFVFELTRRCNNDCRYCYNVWRSSVAHYASEYSDELSTQQIKEIILKLQEETEVATICLSGGEPLLRADLPEIIRFLRSLGITVSLITNGTLLTEQKVEEMAGVANYEVPLLSCRQEIHDCLVGRSSAWDAVIEGMMNVHLSGARLSVVFVATRQNWTELEATASFAAMLGADEFIYKRVNVGKANLRHADELFLSPAMIEENLNTLDKLAVDDKITISADLVIEPCVLDVRQFQHLKFGWCPLAGEESAFVIDPAGNVRICEHSPEVLGNIIRDSFRDLYHHPYVEVFRTVLPPECEKCQSPFKDMCRGGCKAAAAQAYGSLTRIEPFVALNR